MPYLLKTEPGTYSVDDLEREGETMWDGVSNPVAVRNLAGMQRGEMLVIYHTGDEKRTVGLAKVVSVDASDAKNPQVRIKFVKKTKTPRTLAEIKAQKHLCGLAAGAAGAALGGSARPRGAVRLAGESSAPGGDRIHGRFIYNRSGFGDECCVFPLPASRTGRALWRCFRACPRACPSMKRG